MDTTAKKERLWNPAFINIFIVNLFLHMGQQMISTLVPKYADFLGAPSSIVGLVGGLFAISAIAIRPVASPAFDCFRKKLLLQFTLAVIAASYLLFSLADSVPLVIVGRLLQGVGVGCSAPLALSMACETLPDNMLGRGVSIFSLGQAFGQALGPSIGLSLTGTWGYPYTFLLGLFMIVISFVALLFVKSSPRPANARYRISLKTIITKEAVPPALIMTCLALSYACINAFLAIYGGLLEIGNIGLYFTVYAICLLVMRPLTGKLADRFGFGKVLVPGMCFFALTFLMFSISTSLTGIIIAAVCSALGYGVCQPTIQALCMKNVPKEKRGVGSNTIFLGQDIGQFMGPYAGGIIIDAIVASGVAKVSAYAIMYRIMIIPMAVGLVMFFLMRKKLK